MRNCVYRRSIKIRKRMDLYIPAFFFTFIFIGYAKAQPRENDFGIWLNANLEKDIGNKWSAGINTEIRTMDNTRSIDRWQAGVNGSYKICQTLRLNAGYEIHLKNRNVDGISEIVPRHRMMLGLSKRWNVVEWLKLSIRERYQYTYMTAKSNIDATSNHHLRCRLKAEMEINNVRWKPFASIETFNNIAKHFNIDEIRGSTGSTYKISRHHIVYIAYIINLKEANNGLNKASHVVNSGYILKF